MDSPFLNLLIAVSVNLVVMILIYSLLANALIRLHWRGRGAPGVIALILVAGLCWIVTPRALALGGLNPPPGGAFWFGNWLVLGCSVVLLCQRGRWIPRGLEDLARTDGCSWFATYRQIVLPLVRRELAVLALLTAMTFDFSETRDFPPWFYLMLQVAPNDVHIPAGIWLATIIGSLIMTLPVILIFFLAKRYLEGPSIRLREAKPNFAGAE